MEVQQYLFQSPYSSAVQVGRVDPSTKQDEGAQSGSAPAPVKAKTFGEILQNDTKSPQKVSPTVESGQALDVYT